MTPRLTNKWRDGRKNLNFFSAEINQPTQKTLEPLRKMMKKTYKFTSAMSASSSAAASTFHNPIQHKKIGDTFLVITKKLIILVEIFHNRGNHHAVIDMFVGDGEKYETGKSKCVWFCLELVGRELVFPPSSIAEFLLDIFNLMSLLTCQWLLLLLLQRQANPAELDNEDEDRSHIGWDFSM